MDTSIKLAQLLKVKPKDVLRCLVMPLGTKVVKGDIIAMKKNLFGKVTEIRSEFEGILESLSPAGELVISPLTTKAKNIIMPSHGDSNKIYGVFGFGKRKGPAHFCQDCQDLTDIDCKLKEKIIYIPKLVTKTLLFKASALEVAGIIVGMAQETFCNRLKLMVAPQANIAFLVLTHQEDEIEKQAVKIKKWNGKTILLDGQANYVSLAKSEAEL